MIMHVKQRGISILELVIVLAILAAMSAVVISSFSRFSSRTTFSDSKEKIMLALTRARSRTLASENGMVYGVHFQSDKVVLFTGSTYATSSVTNEPYLIDGRAPIHSISIVGGSNVVFKRLTGETTNTGTEVIRAYSDKWLWSTTTISASGIIE